jgi:hypothetical protein
MRLVVDDANLWCVYTVCVVEHDILIETDVNM